MSKSKKNTVDPQEIFDHYGADSVRLFILSDSPPEKDVQWSDQGMQAAHKFIQKFWGLHCEIKNNFFLTETTKKVVEEKNFDIDVFTNQILHKITQNLENFHYNVIIANLHEIYNFFSKAILNKNLNIESLNTAKEIFQL